jgi:hypothetical protein
MSNHKIITLDNYNNNKNNKKKYFYYITDIKKTIKYYKLLSLVPPKSFKKKDYEKFLFDYFDNLNLYAHHLDKIILIQRYFKIYLKSKKIKTQGIGLYNKHKCSNQEDFFTLDTINEIEDKYFFSYETNGHIYFFDIRSFNKLIDNDIKNPYTREDIPQYAINSFLDRKAELTKNKIVIKDFDKPKLSPDQLLNSKVLNVFQKIDILNVAAGGINIKWFTDLNVLHLKMLYKILEDIWNYRAELSMEKKKSIVPNMNVFALSNNNVYKIIKKSALQYLLLKEIDTLISSANNIEDKITGSYFVLTALVEVSIPCMEALPWLIQQS